MSLFPEKLTEHNFKEATIQTERKVYQIWGGMLSPSIACQAPFWGCLTLKHIDEGVIESSFLAANGGNTGTGAARIDRVLQEKGEKAKKLMDDCVRTVLRRLSGLVEARGNRSVYVDCPFARFWWREKLASEIEREHPKETKELKIRRTLRLSIGYWERLVTLIVSKNSVFGSSIVRDAFIIKLSELQVNNPKLLNSACKKLGVISASRELGILEFDELLALIHEVLNSLDENLINE